MGHLARSMSRVTVLWFADGVSAGKWHGVLCSSPLCEGDI